MGLNLRQMWNHQLCYHHVKEVARITKELTAIRFWQILGSNHHLALGQILKVHFWLLLCSSFHLLLLCHQVITFVLYTTTLLHKVIFIHCHPSHAIRPVLRLQQKWHILNRSRKSLKCVPHSGKYVCCIHHLKETNLFSNFFLPNNCVQLVRNDRQDFDSLPDWHQWTSCGTE